MPISKCQVGFAAQMPISNCGRECLLTWHVKCRRGLKDAVLDRALSSRFGIVYLVGLTYGGSLVSPALGWVAEFFVLWLVGFLADDLLLLIKADLLMFLAAVIGSVVLLCWHVEDCPGVAAIVGAVPALSLHLLLMSGDGLLCLEPPRDAPTDYLAPEP
ncbi:hypothetical protein Nepgr_002581 [Nepenthes gracilis]|uniref:Uncharacterized protein n=1 Tax=Nepenthes gracilis TaxID=150966 RepID=A0AAD3PA50_NEPGR|nr:hypothetical protein Nepgr_002581 [Nepenthes gracilis]